MARSGCLESKKCKFLIPLVIHEVTSYFCPGTLGNLWHVDGDCVHVLRHNTFHGFSGDLLSGTWKADDCFWCLLAVPGLISNYHETHSMDCTTHTECWKKIAWVHTTASLCRPLCALRLRCLLVKGQAKMKWSLPSQAHCSLNDNAFELFKLDMSFKWLEHHDWVFPLLLEMRQKLNMQLLYNGLHGILGGLFYTYLHPWWKLMKSVGSHGSLSLLFVMEVTVWHFVTNSHKVMTALIVVLPLECCCVCLLFASCCEYVDLLSLIMICIEVLIWSLNVAISLPQSIDLWCEYGCV
jgi:hypothetical protein